MSLPICRKRLMNKVPAQRLRPLLLVMNHLGIRITNLHSCLKPDIHSSIKKIPHYPNLDDYYLNACFKTF